VILIGEIVMENKSGKSTTIVFEVNGKRNNDCKQTPEHIGEVVSKYVKEKCKDGDVITVTIRS
jgi:hypothetical protein